MDCGSDGAPRTATTRPAMRRSATRGVRDMVLGVVSLVFLLSCLTTTVAAAAPGAGLEAHAAFSGSATRSMTLLFNVCPQSCAGIHVFVDAASNQYQPTQRYSNCTASETSTDFYPRYNGTLLTVSMYSKADGRCAFEPSRNAWIVVVYRGEQRIMRGVVWLGENAPGLAKYYAACGGASPWGDPTFENMTCKSTGTFDLTISQPDWKPTYPECPTTTASYCSLQVHLDAVKPCFPSTFSGSVGVCVGTSDGNPRWTVPKERLQDGVFTAFAWCELGACRYQGKRIAIYVISRGGAQVGVIGGVVPSAGSDQFQVAFAYLYGVSGLSYGVTQLTAPAGQPGGPLNLNFKSGRIGADVYIRGFLETRTVGAALNAGDLPRSIGAVPHLEGSQNVIIGNYLSGLFSKLHP